MEKEVKEFKVEATVIMGHEMTVEEARKRIMDALRETGAKSFILYVEEAEEA